MTNLRRRTIAGLGWSGATQILSKGLQFAAMIILARLLNPEDFGLIGMVFVITGFAASIADAGLAASIIQRQVLSSSDLDSVFWLSITVGAALTLVFSFAAPVVANFYDEPRLRLLTLAVALNFILGSLSVVQYALLQKSLDFRSRLWIELAANSASLSAAVVLALAGAGVWSLAGQLLCGTASRSAVIWWLSPWRPRLMFDWGAV